MKDNIHIPHWRRVQLRNHMAEHKVNLSFSRGSMVKRLPSLARTKPHSILNAFESMGRFPWYHCGIMAGTEGYSGWNSKRAGSLSGLADSGILIWLFCLVSFLLWCTGKLDHPPFIYSCRFRVSGAIVWGTAVSYWAIISVGDFSCFPYLLGIIQHLPSLLGSLLLIVGPGLGWVEPSWLQICSATTFSRTACSLWFPWGRDLVFLYSSAAFLKGFLDYELRIIAVWIIDPSHHCLSTNQTHGSPNFKSGIVQFWLSNGL